MKLPSIQMIEHTTPETEEVIKNVNSKLFDSIKNILIPIL